MYFWTKYSIMIMNSITPAIPPLVVAIAILAAGKYKYDKSRFHLLLGSFFLGIIISFLVILGHYIVSVMGFSELKSIKRVAFFAFVVVGFGHETAKFLVLRFYAISNEMVNRPSQGIIHSALIGLAVTSVMVVYFSEVISEYPFFNFWIYLYTIAALIISVPMGFFAGLGKSRQNRFIDSMTGLFASSFFHGLFFFCYISSESLLGILAAIGTSAIAAILIAKALNYTPEK